MYKVCSLSTNYVYVLSEWKLSKSIFLAAVAKCNGDFSLAKYFDTYLSDIDLASTASTSAIASEDSPLVVVHKLFETLCIDYISRLTMGPKLD